jgi:hypothetical protein
MTPSSFGNFGIENTMEMGPGGAELLEGLFGAETATASPDQVEKSSNLQLLQNQPPNQMFLPKRKRK